MNALGLNIRRESDKPRELAINERLAIYRVISNVLKTASPDQLAVTFQDMHDRRINRMSEFAQFVTALHVPFVPRMNLRPRLVRALRYWVVSLQAGDTLTECMTGWIPPSEAQIIFAGEKSNQLPNAFDDLIRTVELVNRLQRKLRAALAYPIIVFIGAFLVGTYIAMTMVPEFRNLASNQPRHPLTQLLLGYTWLIETAPYVVFGAAVAIVAAFFASFRYWTGLGRTWADHNLPPWVIYRQVYGMAFMRAYSVLTQAGVQSTLALNQLARSATPYMASRLYAIENQVLPGANLGNALDNTGYDFPDPAIIENIILLPEDSYFNKNLRIVLDAWAEDINELIDQQTTKLNALAIAGIGFVVLSIWIGIMDLVPIGSMNAAPQTLSQP